MNNLQIKHWAFAIYVHKNPYGSAMLEDLQQVLLKLDHTALLAYDGVSYEP